MRVYVPSTVPALREVLAARSVPAGTAFAVTPELREWYAQSDGEELEYAALLAAARASLRLLDLDPRAPRRRVVVVADVADSDVKVRDDLERGAVALLSPLPYARLQAVHVDDADAEESVRAAADAVLEADLGGTDATFVVDGAEGHDLMWYAVQELPDILESISVDDETR